MPKIFVASSIFICFQEDCIEIIQSCHARNESVILKIIDDGETHFFDEVFRVLDIKKVKTLSSLKTAYFWIWVGVVFEERQ